MKSFIIFLIPAFLLNLTMPLTGSAQTSETISAPQEKRVEIRAVKVETLIDDLDGGTGGLTIDAKGNLYCADFGWQLGGRGKGGHQIFKVTPDGKSSVFSKQMRGASGNTIDQDGNIYQSSIGGSFLSKITPEGKVTIVTRKGLKSPVGVVADEHGNLFVNNCGAGTITRIDSKGNVSEFCKSNLFKCPNGITKDNQGNFYVANFSNGDVIKVDPKGKATKLATLPGNNNGHITYFGGALYVVARKDNRIYRVTMDGKSSVFVGSGERGKTDGKPMESSLSLPNDLCFSPDGKFLYVNETSPIKGDHRILGPTRIRRITLEKVK